MEKVNKMNENNLRSGNKKKEGSLMNVLLSVKPEYAEKGTQSSQRLLQRCYAFFVNFAVRILCYYKMSADTNFERRRIYEEGS
jgi:hypothetical protein